MFAAQGALAALYRRTVTGEGQVVDAALTESCLAVQESTIPDYDVGGVVRGPSGTRLEGIAPSNIYPHRRRQLGGDRRQPGHRVPAAVRGDGPARSWPPTTGSPITLRAAAIRTSSTRSSATGRPSGSPTDIIATLSRRRGDQRADQHRRRGGRGSAAAGPRHDRRPLGRTHRPQRQGSRRGAGALGDARAPSATPARRGRVSTTTRSTAGCSASTDAELDALRAEGVL